MEQAPGREERECPACRAQVPAAATVCPACARELSPAAGPQVGAPPAPASPVPPGALVVSEPLAAVAATALGDAPAAGGPGGARPSRVSERLRALGRPPRDPSDFSDTMADRPPLPSPDDSPLPEIAPRAPRGDEPPLPPIHPVRVSWLLALAVAVACWAVGSYTMAGVSEGRLTEVGGLLAQRWHEPWRLVVATFVHQNVFLAVLTAVMILIFGGELERRAGPGVVLFLLVVGGVGLNAARVATEPGRALVALAGGWPAGLALGGAALALSMLAPAPGARRPWQVFLSLGLEVAIIAALAQQAGVLGAGLQGVLFLSLGGGLVAGLLLSLARGVAPGGGCLLGGLAIATLLGAQAERERGRSARPPQAPWDPPLHRVVVEDLTPTKLEDLHLSADLPSWSETAATCKVKCPGCKKEVSLTASRGKSAEKVPCPECGRPGLEPKPRLYVFLHDAGFFQMQVQRRLLLWSLPRGQFDAADTLVARRAEELARGEWGDFRDVTPVAERKLGEDDPEWQAAARWESAWVLVVRGVLNGQPAVSRQYILVGAHRTVQLITFEPDDGGAPPDLMPGAALFDAVAKSVRELPK